MDIPRIGFGNGFVRSKGRINPAKLHPVDISTGMPIVTAKHVLGEKKGKPVAKQKFKEKPTQWKEGEKLPPPGEGGRFKALEKAVAEAEVRDPGALAAAIGRKKYGKEKFQKMAAAGRKKKNKKK